MKGPAKLTMLMFLALALFAYATAGSPTQRHDVASLFKRSAVKTSCPLGSHYSSFYRSCTPSWTPGVGDDATAITTVKATPTSVTDAGNVRANR